MPRFIAPRKENALDAGMLQQHFSRLFTPLDKIQHTFWEAYAMARGFNQAERRRELERCLRFGAARLVWAAIEQRLYAARLDPAATALLQVSLNILQNPVKAMAELLDL